MRFPIDVIFLSREKKVVKLVRSLEPWRIAVSIKAHSVLELEAGTIDHCAVSVGDQLRFQAT
jgi:uncharacterized membrane protein (UPF0127 family)